MAMEGVERISFQPKKQESGAIHPATENLYARDLVGGEKAERMERIRQEIAVISERLSAIQVRIERMVAETQKGQSVARESMPAATAALNLNLTSEVQEEKNRLLDEQEQLTAQKAMREAELAA